MIRFIICPSLVGLPPSRATHYEKICLALFSNMVFITRHYASIFCCQDAVHLAPGYGYSPGGILHAYILGFRLHANRAFACARFGVSPSGSNCATDDAVVCAVSTTAESKRYSIYKVLFRFIRFCGAKHTARVCVPVRRPLAACVPACDNEHSMRAYRIRQ